MCALTPHNAHTIDTILHFVLACTLRLLTAVLCLFTMIVSCLTKCNICNSSFLVLSLTNEPSCFPIQCFEHRRVARTASHTVYMILTLQRNLDAALTDEMGDLFRLLLQRRVYSERSG